MFGTAINSFCTDVLPFLFSTTSTDARDHQTSITDDTKVAARCTGEMHDMQTRWGIHWKSCQQGTTGSNLYKPVSKSPFLTVAAIKHSNSVLFSVKNC
jgi:hypothetical protein